MSIFILLILSLVILGVVILWSKLEEKKRGYATSHKWTTDTGKAPFHMRAPYFTKHAQQKMKDWYLSEKQVLNTLYTGQIRENNVKVKKYNGYEIGLYYLRDQKDGHYVITSCWKRKTG